LIFLGKSVHLKSSKIKKSSPNASPKKFARCGEVDVVNVVDTLTSEKEPPLEYWKELAEQRGVALEEALKENEILTEKVERLEKENHELEEMVTEAKQLAEMINTLAEETADESGIVKDADESTISQNSM
jgi:Asp-tRNA(Asn)/Glu-tRNA(Gln) amidotransferase B subunit